MIVKIREPQTTALIHASGQMIVSGAKSEEKARLAARKHARIVQKLGFEVVFSDFDITDIMRTCKFGFGVDLTGLARANGGFCSSYEPEVSFESVFFPF